MHAQPTTRSESDRAEAPADGVNSRLLAKVGHELRTPLNVILGMLHLSLSEDVPAAARQYLETAKDSAVAMTTVLNDILDYSNAVSGSMQLASQPFSLRRTVDDAVDSMAKPASEKGLRLVCHIQDSIPDQLVGDAVRLRQVLLHLLSNAVKFTERGELEVQVVGACPVHNQVSLTFSIIDSGLGIARDDQRRIFSAFEQVDNSTTRLYGGAGLGLTMAAELLRRMGGQLSVESRLGHGSRFSFQLSLRTDADIEDAAEPAAEPAPRRPLSILLAEDTPGNQQVICSILGKRGHSTLVASNGAEAVQSFRSRQQGIDVILMDVSMPVMDGYDATAEIRRLESGAGRRVPIIALTAHAPQGSQQECFAAGMDAYISKPIDLRKLTDAVEQFGYGRSWLREDRTGCFEAGNGDKGTLVDIPGVMKRLGGDLALLKEFVQVFDEDAPQLLESLRTALACGDASAMERGAHSLKGLTSNFGASRVVELAGKVEDAARVRRLDGGTQVLVQQLEREVSRLMAALADYR